MKKVLFISSVYFLHLFYSTFSFATTYTSNPGACSWTNSANWSPTNPPSPGTVSDIIVIPAGSTVSITTSTTFNGTVNVDGTLNCSGTSIRNFGTLNVNNGGTFTTAGTSCNVSNGVNVASGGTITINHNLNITGGTFTLNGLWNGTNVNGKITVSSNAGTTIFGDNTATPATPNSAVFLELTTNDQTIDASANLVMPRLGCHITTTGKTFTNDGTITLTTTAASSYALWLSRNNFVNNGTLTTTGYTGTQSVALDLNTSLTNNGTMTITRAIWLAQSSSTVTNNGTMYLTGAGGVIYGGASAAGSSFTNSPGASLFIAGDNFSGAKLTVDAMVTFYASSANNTVIFNGTDNQYIRNPDDGSYYDVVINNTASSANNLHPCLVNGVTISNQLTLTNGFLGLRNGTTGIGQTLTIANPAINAIVGGSPAAYIKSELTDNSGKVKWNIGNAPSGTYLYPFGVNIPTGSNNNYYIPFQFSVTAGGTQAGTGNVTLATYHTDPALSPNNRPLPPTVTNLDYNSLENCNQVVDRFWQIDVNNYSANPVADIVFTYPDPEWNVPNNSFFESDLLAQRWDVSTSAWQAGVGVVNTASNTVSVTGVSTFSPWTLAGNNFSLPVQLVSFSVSCLQTNFKLNWTTASEINNDYFNIERNVQRAEASGPLPGDWETIGMVKGIGNSSSIHNYEFIDSFSGNTFFNVYYKLKQIDLDGNHEYFGPVAVKNNCNNAANPLILSPNPVGNELVFQFFSDERKNIVIEVYDSYGKLVVSQSSIVSQGNNLFSLDISFIAGGVYVMGVKTTSANGGPLYQKFIRQ